VIPLENSTLPVSLNLITHSFRGYSSRRRSTCHSGIERSDQHKYAKCKSQRSTDGVNGHLKFKDKRAQFHSQFIFIALVVKVKKE